MNEELVIKMAKPYLKNGTLTYELFDKIYEILSRKEQYQVCEILNKYNIELVDSFDTDAIAISEDLLQGDESIEDISNSDNYESFVDESVFKDPISSTGYVFLNKEIKQSNDTLIRLIKQGNRQAQQDICVKNEGLVRKYAAAYFRYFGNDLDYEDLLQAGFIGILSAVDRFDFNKETAFSTYAIFWIKQAISRQIFNEGYRVRIPVHMMERIKKITRLDNKYEAEKLDFHQRIQNIAKDMELTEDEVEISLEIKHQFLGNVSLDTPVGEDEDTPLGELILADESYDVENEIMQKMLADSINEVLSTLTKREEKIIRFRYGFDDHHPRTLEEVGKEFNVTRERIRQIEQKALRKLRHPTRSKKLKDYLND